MDENIIIDSSPELEQMRHAMVNLREQLSQQRIVNEKLLRQVLIGKSGFVIKLVNSQLYIIAPVCSLVFIGAAAVGLCSWAFAVVTAILMCASGIFDKMYYVGKKDLATMPMVAIAEKVSMQKRREPWKMAVETLVMIPWCVWFFTDFFASSDFPEEGKWFSIGFAAFTSLIILIVLYIRLRDSQDNVLRSVDQFLGETRES